MRKCVLFLFFLSLILISEAGCTSQEVSDNISSNKMVINMMDNRAECSRSMSGYSSNDIDEFGIELYATNITPTGMTMVCTQAGGSVDGEIRTYNLYTVEENIDGIWEEIELQDNLYWADEILKVNEGESTEWDIDWTATYGNLAAGKYRIRKEFTNINSEGESISVFYFVEFSIK